MTEKKILQLGDERLYYLSSEVLESDLPRTREIIQDLHDTIIAFQKEYGWGRAIAAPQIGEHKKIIYVFWDKPYVFINPILELIGKKEMILWDDCMSFPQILVKLKRSYQCRITYRDLEFKEHSEIFEGAWSELLQHECDHLDGILSIQRMQDTRSIALRSEISDRSAIIC